MTAEHGKKLSPMLRWLTLSGVDAVGRLILQITGTVIFARLLLPESFGLASLTIVYVGLLSMVVTALFEEALTQRKHVRKTHFTGALTVALGVASTLYMLLLIFIVTIPEDKTDSAAVASLAGIYALILFVDAPLSIHNALARRMRRFSEMALGKLLGLAAGTTLGVSLALAGYGVWGLLAVSATAKLVNLLFLAARAPVSLYPGTDISQVRSLFNFGRWSLGTRWLGSLTQTIIQTLVTRYFGLEGNGYLNMAMRIIEPLHGITVSIGHNISMSFFSRMQADPKKLRTAVQQTIADTALLLQPIYIGLAVTASLIIEVIAGPEWQAAGPVATVLALGVAIKSAGNYLHTSLLATGRPGIGFTFSALDLLGASALLILLSPLGLISISLARLISWSFDFVLVSAVARKIYGLQVSAMIRPLLMTSLCTAAMASMVLSILQWGQAFPSPVLLALAIIGGAAVYGLALLLMLRAELLSVINRLRQQGS